MTIILGADTDPAVAQGIVAKYAAVGQQSLVFSVIMLSGFLQMVLGWLRLGSYIQLVPRPVTSGFMTGIGCGQSLPVITARIFGCRLA